MRSLNSIIAPKDFAIFAKLWILFLLSWITPIKHFLFTSKMLTSGRQLLRRDLENRASRIASILKGRDIGIAPDEIIRTYDAYFFLERLQLLRMYRPGGWTPNIRLEGRQHIEEAAAGGNGAILWIAPFSFHRQVTKMAFSQAGFRVNHLSRYFHGFDSYSWFGEHFLNSIRTGQEERFLSQRLVIGRDGSKDVMARLEKLLEENQLVSITVGRQARRTRQVDFFNGKLTIATGPAFLSHRTKAPLLPVFTIRESNQDYVVSVEPPVCDAGSKDVDGYIEMAVTKYVALLEKYALKHPAQFFNGYPSMCDI